jgi:hypothetical protein
MKYFFLLFIFASSVILSNGFLKTAGTKIVDESGSEVLFKGIGLGGWLLPEGYMFHMSGFANSPTEIKNKIIDVVGLNNTETIFEEFRNSFITEADIDSIANWGFNTIRLPMHYNLLTPADTPYVYSEKGFATIDTLINWCKKNNIYLILDLHAAPGGQSDEPISDYNPNLPSLWENNENKQRTIELWREIASRYKDETIVAGYDLLNEPKWDLGSQNTDLRKLYIDITTAIRNVDTNHIIFIEGNWFATDFNGLTPPWDDNMVYSFHKYWSEVTTNSIQNYLSIRNNYSVPLWMGESGENSNSWFVDFIKLLNKNNIGWSWWTHKKLQSISPLTSSPISPQFQQLLNYWNGSAPKPSTDFAMVALRLQIENMKIKNCSIRFDVINAIMEQPYDNKTFSYSLNTLPGKLYGVNYDFGNLSYSYYDTTPDNLGNEIYNSGSEYRNDGVDIEKCSDQYTNGYNIGWIETGEWLKYTINISQTDNYKIRLRTAAPNSGGKIQLILDGELLSNLTDIPATGGWQNWQTIELPILQLPVGIHELVIRFYFGGFNFNYIEFEQTGVNVTDLNNRIYEFSLEQNYPNPFNPTSIIKFSLNKESKVELKIYSIIGEELTTLIQNKTMAAGNHEIEFNALSTNQQLSSGVYFYRIIAEGFTDVKKMILLK